MSQHFHADADLYRGMAEDQGMTFREERYAAAVEAHASMRDALVRLRQASLPYAADMREPTSATAWLEGDGIGR